MTERERTHVAVIGAGLAGLACARQLHEAGAQVVVLEKSRGPGGRMATARGDDWQGDLGAQYFTARDPAFVAAVEEWQREGVAARWSGQLVRLGPEGVAAVDDDRERWVGGPRMSAITRNLAQGLDMLTGTRVTGISGRAGQWWLHTDDDQQAGAFHAVVIAVPAPQAAPLLEALTPVFHERAAAVVMRPCWSAVMRVNGDALPFDAAFVEDASLRWVARDGSKPGRAPDTGIWTVHAGADYSQRRLEADPHEVAEELAAAFRVVTGMTTQPEVLRCHRWRYSQCTGPLTDGYLLAPEAGIGVCGDWCRGSRVEDAWLSGSRLADALV